MKPIYLFLYSILILLFLNSCLFLAQDKKKHYERPYKEAIFENGFIGGGFYTYDYETNRPLKIFAHIKHRITKGRITQMTYVTYHDGNTNADSLIYEIDFNNPTNANWIYYDQQYNTETDLFEIKLDTFDLEYKAHIEFIYDSIFYKILKYEANPTDSTCVTHYISDTLGLLKKYHPKNSGHHSLSVEMNILPNNPKYPLYESHFEAIKENQTFHTRCDGKLRWIGYELLDSLQNERKLSDEEEAEKIIRMMDNK